VGIKAELLPGSRGAFDVIVDGRTIFSKHATHRFPDDSEIIRALRA
jgi:selT/selW/selH-like putative selenoprotein